MLSYRDHAPSAAQAATLLTLLSLFLSGFTALLYQVVWQRMLGLFSGSDVRSVTIVVASYLLGLGMGSLLGGLFSDRLSSRRAVQLYGGCNLAIAGFAVLSRYLFYDLLFQRWQFLAQSTLVTLVIVWVSLLLPTTLMGLSLPLLAKAVSRRADQAAARIGMLYGVNTLGSGIGTLVTGWYIVGTLGYEGSLYLGAALSALAGVGVLLIARQFPSQDAEEPKPAVERSGEPRPSTDSALWTWSVLVFCSGFAAISLEILWFRVLETVLQSIAYTYAHLLAFILLGNALGSLLGAAAVRSIRHPRQMFLAIQGAVAAYALISLWGIAVYRQLHPIDLRIDIGFIDPHHLDATLLFRYGVVPLVMLLVPSVLLGFYVPLVQKAVQTDDQQIGRRVGTIQVANILGNTAGSLLTGLLLLDRLGTTGSLRLLGLLGLGLVLLMRSTPCKWLLVLMLATLVVVFPNQTRFWAALHGIPASQLVMAAEDSTGVALVTEANQQGTLLASGQAQASFPYLQVHAVLGSLPALMHPNPAQILIIGLGSGGTAHTIGVHPLTQQVRVVELLGAELMVLPRYAQTPVGRPLQFLFADPRYRFVVGDGRRELTLSPQLFDLIEADAIYPWRSRAGMLYSQEFFREVQRHLAPGGLFVEWDVGFGTEPTFRSVFPYVMQLAFSGDLYVLIGSNQPISFDRQQLLGQLAQSPVQQFLAQAGVSIEGLRQEVQAARVQLYSQAKDGRPEPVNTDLFPRAEYYLNHRF